MNLTVLKSKLHRACVTHSERDYEGSCAIDSDLMAAAGIHEYEQIMIYNVSNGERFTTYAIRGEVGSKIISVNGAAAHRASPGDRIIICTYAAMDADKVADYKPTLVYLDEENYITHTRQAIPVQAA